ncbi:mpv17-like protein 2 [Octopus bimaculoides]|uniref:Mpv17-like protein 2 n=1 Tax=Octopus bimaculoides TaxID=37653 RepID=A0A0L8HDN3_OCTBM|nr:mpv17-like protein 2 [Octopus bimaculoides]|eukprot:XP_014773370.1 PREDICTED: mpv17-like protein 2 [Octopus bimaculoides]
MALSKTRNVVKKLFSKYLLLTNTVTCGGLLAVGDAFTQKIEHLGHDSSTFKYDWPRTGRMFTVGLFMGPATHFWYTFLDKMLVGTAGITVLKKICCDQAVAAPYFCTTFLVGMSLLEGKGWKVAVGELKEKFLTIYMMDWLIWPPSQFINFYFLPTRFRVVYVCFITLIWDALLSYIKHKDKSYQKQDALKEQDAMKMS